MQAGKRVVLMCVGGKDSYAVFEAANDDAAGVLYVGEDVKETTSVESRDMVVLLHKKVKISLDGDGFIVLYEE